jgi:probable phosphoglycerate mutase
MAREFPGPILIVAHAGVNRALLSSLRHLPLDDLLQIPQDYCGVNILELQGNALTVQTINQILL